MMVHLMPFLLGLLMAVSCRGMDLQSCPSCVAPGCTCDKDLDVVFLIDDTATRWYYALIDEYVTGSLRDQDYAAFKQFIADVLGQLNLGSSRVRTAAFDLTYNSQLMWGFSSNASQFHYPACHIIDNIIRNLGDRFTDRGLLAAKNLLTTQGRPGALKSIVLITYGESISPADTLLQAQAVHDLDIPICVAAVTSNFTVEVSNIVGPTSCVITSPSFDTLSYYVDELVRCLCSLPEPVSTCSGGLFVTDLVTRYISLVDDVGGMVSPVLRSSNFPTGVDYDINTGFLFWTGYFPEELWRTQVDSNCVEIPCARRRLASFPGRLVSETLEIDRLNNELIVSVWTQGIYRMNFDGSHSRKIVDDHILHSHGVALDTNTDILYFTDFAERNLYRAPADVDNQPLPAPILEDLEELPGGIAFDDIGLYVSGIPGVVAADRVIWLGFQAGISALDLKEYFGNDLCCPSTLIPPNPFSFNETNGMTYLESRRTLFFTDRESGGVFKVDLNRYRPSAERLNLLSDFEWPYGIKQAPNIPFNWN